MTFTHVKAYLSHHDRIAVCIGKRNGYAIEASLELPEAVQLRDSLNRLIGSIERYRDLERPTDTSA